MRRESVCDEATVEIRDRTETPDSGASGACGSTVDWRQVVSSEVSRTGSERGADRVFAPGVACGEVEFGASGKKWEANELESGDAEGLEGVGEKDEG